MQTLIRLKNVVKTYQLGETTVQALRGLDLDIHQGEFTALIGKSGSGKSTLLNLVGGIDTPNSGTISFADEDISQWNEKQRADLRNRKIGFVFQSFNLIPVLSVYENIELPLIIQPEISEQEKKERVLAAIKDVGLEGFENYPPDRLSGGQRQRVAIARALVTRPLLVLADEPTANLDSKTTHMIIDLMVELNRSRKITFLFCTHDEKLIGRVGRVVHIQDGVIQ